MSVLQGVGERGRAGSLPSRRSRGGGGGARGPGAEVGGHGNGAQRHVHIRRLMLGSLGTPRAAEKGRLAQRTRPRGAVHDVDTTGRRAPRPTRSPVLRSPGPGPPPTPSAELLRGGEGRGE